MAQGQGPRRPETKASPLRLEAERAAHEAIPYPRNLTPDEAVELYVRAFLAGASFAGGAIRFTPRHKCAHRVRLRTGPTDEGRIFPCQEDARWMETSGPERSFWCDQHRRELVVETEDGLRFEEIGEG